MGFAMESQESNELCIVLRTNDKIFKKMQIPYFSAFAAHIWAEMNFSQKSGSVTF